MSPRIVGLCALLAALALAGCNRKGKDKIEEKDLEPQDKTVKPGGGDDKPKQTAAVYKTPQECFDASKAAEAKNDHKTYVGCMSPEAQKEMAVGFLMMFHPRPKGKQSPDEEKLDKQLGTVWSKYGLSEKMFEGIDDPKKMEAATKPALAKIKDHAAFLVEVATAMDRGRDLVKEDKSKPTLTDVKVTGDRAVGTVVKDTKFAVIKTPIGFVKIGESWRLAGMDEVKLGESKFEEPPKKELGKPDFKTTAEALIKELKNDEKAFAKKYADKVVELEGAVWRANKPKDFQGFSLIGEVHDPKDEDSYMVKVNCQPAAPKEKDWWLGHRQKLRVVGRVGQSGSFGVNLMDCTYVELSPNTIRKLTAKQLTAEFDKDEDGARKKYLQGKKEEERELIVEGVIAELTETKDDSIVYRVFLEGTGSLRVTCRIGKKEFESLKKGDKITLKGYCWKSTNEDQILLHSGFILK